MPNTYSKIFLQFVMAVKGRQSLIDRAHKNDVHKYISGIVTRRNAKMLAIHCMPDHTHLFVGFRPVMSISDFIKEIKVESNEFINGQQWMRHRFSWQEGYGVFSYSYSHIDDVIRYIQNQEQRHAGQSFQEEYTGILEQFDITYDPTYLFDFNF